jgi:hypothetical protein
MKKPKLNSKLKQSLKSNTDKIKTKIKTKIKPQLTWFSQLLSAENKAKLKTVWLKVDARYAATPKVDKVVIGSAMVLAMGSVAWAAVPAVGTGAGNQEANVAGAQVQIYDWAGGVAQRFQRKFGYSQAGTRPYREGAASTDCSGWAMFVDQGTKKLIRQTSGNKLVSAPLSGTTLTMAQTMAGKNQVVFFRAPRGSNPVPTLGTLKPGMIILHGSLKSPGARGWYYAGVSNAINHVGVVVRIGGKLAISDVRNDNQGRGGVNLYTSTQDFLRSRASAGSSYTTLIGDPLREVRTALGDTASAVIDANTIATGETPGVGEIGGVPGLFGQPVEGNDNPLIDGTYAGDSNLEQNGITQLMHNLVMGRVASSAWHRGVTLASEPRLIAELAYMKTIQNIMAQARSASIERRESLSAAYLGTVKEPVLENKNKEQYSTVTKNGAE